MTKENPQTEAERWIRDEFLPGEYGQKFRQKNLLLQSRGEATFAAVSDDGEVVAAICVSRGHDPDGRVDNEALMKVRSDALKILWLDTTPAKRFMLMTDPGMIAVIREEKRKGRFPKELQIIRVKLPASLEEKMESSQKHVSPSDPSEKAGDGE